jgi:Cu2+-containing amine oxidase
MNFKGEFLWPIPKDTITTITDEESIELQCGNAFLWFYGHLVYEDIFGHAHETRFCWRYNAGYDRYDQDGADENRRT